MAQLLLRPSAGSTFSVSATIPADTDAASYAALTFVQVGGMDNIGEIGATVEIGNFRPLDAGEQFYRHVKTAPSFDSAPADLPDDAGQAIVKTAFEAPRGTAAERLAVKVEDEAGYGVYFTALVGKFSRQYGGAEDLQLRNMTFQPDPDSFVEFEPAAVV